jgi:hypothetical protein
MKEKKPEKNFDKDAEHLAKVIQMFIEKYGTGVQIPEDALPEGIEFPQFAAGTTMKFLMTMLNKDAWKSEAEVKNNDLNYIG